jgi:hypothetical protein
MGASESKLVFKQGIFRLSEEKDIPADDPYWARVRFLLHLFVRGYVVYLTIVL